MISTFLVQSTQAQASFAEEDPIHSDEVDSDRFSGSNSSFLANEKLVSMDSMNSDITGILLSSLEYSIMLNGLSDNINCFPDDDSQDMRDDEMQLYFNKLVPPVMQRGRVEGQEIPATVRLPFHLENLHERCFLIGIVQPVFVHRGC